MRARTASYTSRPDGTRVLVTNHPCGHLAGLAVTAALGQRVGIVVERLGAHGRDANRAEER